jgi:hypothetical protein
LKIDLRVLNSDSCQCYFLEVPDIDRRLIEIAFILGVRRTVILQPCLLSSVNTVMELLLAVLDIYELVLTELLIVKAVDQMMNDELECLLRVEKPDSLNIDHVLDEESLLF